MNGRFLPSTYEKQKPMMDFIRTLIRESFLELREDAFAQDILGRIGQEETIIGKGFAQELVKAIPELEHYGFSEYMPIGQDAEKWSFEVDTADGYLNIVTVYHGMVNGAIAWKFTFGRAAQSMEAMTVEMQYKTPTMSDYDAFIEKVNADWQKWG